MANVFNEVQIKKPNRSYFDLSHDHKTSFDMGQIIPVMVQECLPSDKFTIKSEALIRMMPMIAPIMHKVDVFMHYFFVPNRILWKNWERFISPPNLTILPHVPPYMNTTDWQVQPGMLADYLGLPLGDYNVFDNEQAISALPFVAYQKIWFEYYRDQNLQDETYDSFEDLINVEDGLQLGTDTLLLSQLRYRAWEHDYYTSQLPFAQKGQPVTLPIEISSNVFITQSNGELNMLNSSNGTPYTLSGALNTDGAMEGPDGTKIIPEMASHLSGSFDDISTSTSINDLRAAYALQKWLEKNARGGTRYNETLLVHFGVHSSDARLQRPEYIGGSRSTMAISEVIQTDGNSSTPLGDMGGHGITIVGGNDVDYYCEEFGFILGLMSVRPKTAYMQGLPPMFSRFDKLDYPWPDFAFLGEAAIKNQEVYLNFTAGSGIAYNKDTFGYLPRYTDYRYNPSRASGEMRTSLSYWHLARDFETPPTLSAEFIECKPSKRIFAVVGSTDHSLVAHIFHKVHATRPIPRYGNPEGLM